MIVLAVGTSLFMRRRRTPKQQPVSPPSTMDPSAHFLSPSDMTMLWTGSLGYTTLSSSPAQPVERSGSVRTHNTNAHSLPNFSSPVTTIPRTTQPTARPTNPSNLEDIIVPFHIPPGRPINPPLGDRKNPNGSFPVHDAPTAPPGSLQSRTEPSAGSSRRARVNPPAYSASKDPLSPPPRAQRGLLRHGSTDTHHTDASGTQNNGGHTNDSSLSITSSDVWIPETSAAAGGRIVTGTSTGDAKRRPTMDNDNVSHTDSRDIA